VVWITGGSLQMTGRYKDAGADLACLRIGRGI